MQIRTVSAEVVKAMINDAMVEDHAHRDITTRNVVPETMRGTARLVAREPGIAAGIAMAEAAFLQNDKKTTFHQVVEDGARFQAGDVLAEGTGLARALLQGERVALNFVQRLCGIATLTGQYVDAIEGTGVQLLDTRKTTPRLRALEKYAVRCGGGSNHRFDLESMAMIKDNHREAIAADGKTLAEAVAAIREAAPNAAVEVEIDSEDELEAALAGEPEWVLLDNMDTVELRRCVEKTAGRAKLEASGGITLETIRAVAETGVDAVSVGVLTHGARALDLSLEIVLDQASATD